MEDALRKFELRQRALVKKHHRMARGYVTVLSRNGIFLQQPDNKVGSNAARVFALLLVFFLAFKGFLIAGLGTDVYMGHVDALMSGSLSEQVGGWLMQMDPVSTAFSNLFSPLLS
ncbi:hypothetical protein KUH32_09165 [Thalassococcus sp. CAU 1522]|uniref:Uncharacterized protein n=1 Tax=Thalassococcus arenae TaxID=2851652 RepID=A0ABS6N7G4_9RHOB|nr:hypothetical protein [Thalassococcus arenae]MBV2359943.1 hypothetical protein [Thalassococcus arenae]